MKTIRQKKNQYYYLRLERIEINFTQNQQKWLNK